MKIITTIGGPCIYKRGILKDGTETGRIQYTGQDKETLERELMTTLETGRDDVQGFVHQVFIARGE